MVHSHWVAAILNLSPNPWTTAAGLLPSPNALTAAAGLLAPGFGDSHAAQIVRVSALLMQQTEQLQVPEGGLNLSPKPCEIGLIASVLGSADLLALNTSITLPSVLSSTPEPLSRSITLPVFNSGAGVGCLQIGGGGGDLDFRGLTFSGERKVKTGGVDVSVA